MAVSIARLADTLSGGCCEGPPLACGGPPLVVPPPLLRASTMDAMIRWIPSSSASAFPKNSEATGRRTMTPPTLLQGTARGLSRNETRCMSPLGPLSWPRTTVSTWFVLLW